MLNDQEKNLLFSTVRIEITNNHSPGGSVIAGCPCGSARPLDLRRRIVAILLAFLLMTVFGAAPALADRCTRMLSRLQGYTIISVTQVNGKFEGCDFGRVIRFMDGTALKCSSYSYTYSYMPDAVIFGKTTTHKGKSFAIIKALIEGEIFDMEPVILEK